MKINLGLISGILSSGWAALLNILLVPLYVKYLGPEAYGLVGFYTTLQTLFLIFDIGLGSTLGREVARSSTDNNKNEILTLINAGTKVYGLISIAISLVVSLSAYFVARYWLKIDTLTTQTVQNAIILAGILIGVRWPITLYQNILNSAKKMHIVSSVTIATSTIAGLGSVIIIAKFSNSILSFFIWQIIIGLVQTLLLQHYAWQAVGKTKSQKVHFDVSVLKQHWHFTKNIALLGISGLALTQIDKVLLSKMLSLADFGKYMVATTIMGAIYLLVNPVYNHIFPFFSRHYINDNTVAFEEVYLKLSKLFAAFLFPCVFFLVFFMRELLLIWIKNPSLVEDILPLAQLLTIAAGLHGIMYFPYALTLAAGKPMVALKINLILTYISLPFAYLMIYFYGAVGGATSWFILRIFYLIYGTIYTHKKIKLGSAYAWILNCVVIPIFVSLIIGICHLMLSRLIENNIIVIALGIFIMCLVIGILVYRTLGGRETFNQVIDIKL